MMLKQLNNCLISAESQGNQNTRHNDPSEGTQHDESWEEGVRHYLLQVLFCVTGEDAEALK